MLRNYFQIFRKIKMVSYQQTNMASETTDGFTCRAPMLNTLFF